MPTLIATGAFCPAEDLGEPLGAAGWRLVAPEDVAQAEEDPDAAVIVLNEELGRLTDLLAATPSARAIILHVSQEEALASALSDGLEPTAALKRWKASALEQVALFRRMRARVVLVSRRHLETAPAAVLGGDARGVAIPRWRVDPLALALAARVLARLPERDTAASMLAACVREEDRVDAMLDAPEALAAWRAHAALVAGAEAAARAAEEAAGREQVLRDEIGLLQGQLVQMQAALTARDASLADATRQLTSAEKAGVEAERLRAIEASQSEEIALLREQLAHLQKAFEAAWLQKEETRASASRQPPVQAGLTMPVDLGVAALSAP